MPGVEYRDPFYSNPVDVPQRAKMFAGRMFSLTGDSVHDLPEFHGQNETPTSAKWLRTRRAPVVKSPNGWEFAQPPPSLSKVAGWCAEEDAKLLAVGE
jgi:DNA polymerase zeta